MIVRSPSGAPVAAFSAPSSVTGVALALDGKTVAVGDSAGNARTYGLDGTQRKLLPGGHAALTRLAFSPDGKLLAAGSRDHTAKVWDLGSGRLRPSSWGTPMRVVRAVQRGRRPARHGEQGSRPAHLAGVDRNDDPGPARPLRRGEGRRPQPGRPLGRLGGPGKAGLWDARTGELLFFLQGHEGPLTSASFAANSRTIIPRGSTGRCARRCATCASDWTV